MTSTDPKDAAQFDLQALFAALPGNCVVLAPDRNFTMVAVTDERLALTMTRREDTVGRPLFDVLQSNLDDPNGQGVRNLRASLARVLETRAPDRMTIHRCDVQRADGAFEERHWSPVNWPLIGPQGVVTHIIHAAEDVTERVLEERRRQELEAQLRADEAELRQLNKSLEQRVAERTHERDRIWQLSSDLMSVNNAEGRFVAVNPAWTARLGWSQAELRATSLRDLVHPDDVVEHSDFDTDTDTDTAKPRFAIRLRHKYGGYRYISWLVSRDGDLIYAVGRDVTGRLRSEEALRQAQRMEAVGQLTGGVAHDFNNLLTIIRSSADLLARPDLSETRRARYVQAISDTVDRAAKLTGQLLAFARRQPLDPEVFDVKERITTVAELIRPLVGEGVRIDTKVPDGPCAIEADIAQFETALVSLAVNARDAMGGSGELVIEVSQASQVPPIRENPGASGDFVAVTVRDTGSGIAPEHLQSIFEPFFTTKGVGKGTGLGLSQVYGFAKQSGGEIDVKSQLGAGAAFTLYLPRTSKSRPQAADEIAHRRSGLPGDGATVLVVEDNLEVGAFSTEMLHDLGYRTTWVTNAHEALERLREEERSFDIVFSDVVMPGTSGVELAQSIRRDFPGLPVVLTSGYSHVLAEQGRHGFTLLAKPYSAESLAQTLRGALAGQKESLDRPPVAPSKDAASDERETRA